MLEPKEFVENMQVALTAKSEATVAGRRFIVEACWSLYCSSNVEHSNVEIPPDVQAAALKELGLKADVPDVPDDIFDTDALYEWARDFAEEKDFAELLEKSLGMTYYDAHLSSVTLRDEVTGQTFYYECG